MGGLHHLANLELSYVQRRDEEKTDFKSVTMEEKKEQICKKECDVSGERV